MNTRQLGLGIMMLGLLSGCTLMGQPRVVVFHHNPVAADPTAAGTAQIMSMAEGMTQTTLTLTGLTPNKTYAAHYHAFGPASGTDACSSSGPVTVGFPSFTSDATGKATVSMTTETAKIAGDLGAYINVHQGDNLSVVPLCVPLKAAKG